MGSQDDGGLSRTDTAKEAKYYISITDVIRDNRFVRYLQPLRSVQYDLVLRYY